MFNSKFNSNKFFVNYQNKLYTSNVNLLNTSDQFKCALIPLSMKGSGMMLESKEEIVIENLIEMLGSSKDKFLTIILFRYQLNE